MNDVSQKELYRIFNDVLSKSSILEYERIDEEISLFSEKANQKRQENIQLDMFEEPLATSKEIENVVNFCENLKAYYREIDNDKYTEGSLSEHYYRHMYTKLEECSTYVSEENKEKYNNMKRNIQRYLPEYRDKIILEDYIKEAEEIYKLKQKAKRSKENRQAKQSFYEGRAEHFYHKIKEDKKLKTMECCPEMLVLCEKALQIVDCLPTNTFGRIKKFKMKKNINKSRESIAKQLGGAYEKVAEIAVEEQQKYENAIQATKQYLENSQKHRPLTIEERNKRAQDEWDYK